MTCLQMERWRRQLTSCCGKVMGKAKPITGIERETLEAQDEREQTLLMWAELDSRKGGNG